MRDVSAVKDRRRAVIEELKEKKDKAKDEEIIRLIENLEVLDWILKDGKEKKGTDEKEHAGPIEKCERAVKNALAECDIETWSKDGFISEIRAQYPDWDVLESSLTNYLYKALKKLQEDEVIDKIGRDKYEVHNDYDINKMYKEEQDLIDDSVPLPHLD